MAIQQAFFLVVARQLEVDAKYPGGMTQFRADWLENPLPPCGLADEHLVAFSSMAADGLCLIENEFERFQIAVATGPGKGFSQVDWIESGLLNGTYVCWLKDTEPGEIAWFVPPERAIASGTAAGSTRPRWWQFWK